MNFCWYQIIVWVEHFYAHRGQWAVLTGCFSMGHQPGCEWAYMRRWTKHFTIPTVNCLPKCRDENGWTSPSQYNNIYIVFVMTTEQSAMDRSAHTLSLLCYERTVNTFWQNTHRRQWKVPSYRSENFEASDRYLLLLIELPHSFFIRCSFLHFKIS